MVDSNWCQPIGCEFAPWYRVVCYRRVGHSHAASERTVAAPERIVPAGRYYPSGAIFLLHLNASLLGLRSNSEASP